jgi:hypothetical protein
MIATRIRASTLDHRQRDSTTPTVTIALSVTPVVRDHAASLLTDLGQTSHTRPLDGPDCFAPAIDESRIGSSPLRKRGQIGHDRIRRHRLTARDVAKAGQRQTATRTLNSTERAHMPAWTYGR